jgi:N-acetylmuramoyl-L-alanine amidase
VIDPGHGGNQAGARFREGNRIVYEKDITLAIGLKVAERLAKLGASVIMTRAEDTSIGLYERTAMANQAGAHFFISIHCDSNPRPNSASGTTIYYHRDDADSRALGQAILNEIVKVSGLPSKGVRSDTMLYQSGLAVLRTSQMPAVLIEVGYLNHYRDRQKLLDPQFQDAVAAAIVRGLKAYVEGGSESR